MPKTLFDANATPHAKMSSFMPKYHAHAQTAVESKGEVGDDSMIDVFSIRNVGGSARTPASATRNCAVQRSIATCIGVTDARVQ